ncbi:hypothetical protein QTP86_027238, partial [Hemibagrus guttatus]
MKGSRIELGDVTPHNIKQLKRLNQVIFPVSYNDKFYKDVLEVGELAKLAYFNDIAVGAVCCRVDHSQNQKRLYIMTLGCLAPYRRLGIGTKMLNHVLNICEKDGTFDNIYLHVQISNESAIDFYQKFGFEIIETKKNYYKRIEPADAHVLQKSLRSLCEPPAGDLQKAEIISPPRAGANTVKRFEIERHRKEKINAGIKRIGDLLPCSQALKQSKNMILGEAFRYISELKQQNDEMLLSGGDKVQAEELKRLRQQVEDLRKESAHYIELLKANGINFLDDPTIHWKGKQRCAKVAKITPTHLMSKGIIVYSNENLASSASKMSENPVSHFDKQPINALAIHPSCNVQVGPGQALGVPNGTQINEMTVSSTTSSHIPLATLIPAVSKPCLAVVEQYAAVAPVAPKLPPPGNFVTLQGICPKLAVTAPSPQQTQPAKSTPTLASSTSCTMPVQLQPVFNMSSLPQTMTLQCSLLYPSWLQESVHPLNLFYPLLYPCQHRDTYSMAHHNLDRSWEEAITSNINTTKNNRDTFTNFSITLHNQTRSSTIFNRGLCCKIRMSIKRESYELVRQDHLLICRSNITWRKMVCSINHSSSLNSTNSKLSSTNSSSNNHNSTNISSNHNTNSKNRSNFNNSSSNKCSSKVHTRGINIFSNNFSNNTLVDRKRILRGVLSHKADLEWELVLLVMDVVVGHMGPILRHRVYKLVQGCHVSRIHAIRALCKVCWLHIFPSKLDTRELHKAVP